jgi:hypothetical protein
MGASLPALYGAGGRRRVATARIHGRFCPALVQPAFNWLAQTGTRHGYTMQTEEIRWQISANRA